MPPVSSKTGISGSKYWRDETVFPTPITKKRLFLRYLGDNNKIVSRYGTTAICSVRESLIPELIMIYSRSGAVGSIVVVHFVE